MSVARSKSLLPVSQSWGAYPTPMTLLDTTVLSSQAPTTPLFNVDTFGESLVTGNRSMFQPAQPHSDHSSPSPDSARRLPGDVLPPFSSGSPVGLQHPQHQGAGGPPRQRSTSLPPLPEGASDGGMAAFAGYRGSYPFLLESVVASMAPPTSSGLSPTVSHAVTDINCFHVPRSAPGRRRHAVQMWTSLPCVCDWYDPLVMGWHVSSTLADLC